MGSADQNHRLQSTVHDATEQAITMFITAVIYFNDWLLMNNYSYDVKGIILYTGVVC